MQRNALALNQCTRAQHPTVTSDLVLLCPKRRIRTNRSPQATFCFLFVTEGRQRFLLCTQTAVKQEQQLLDSPVWGTYAYCIVIQLVFDDAGEFQVPS